MANVLISVRINEELLKDITNIIKSQGYANVQEFLRNAAREKIQKEKLANAAIALEKLYGLAKNKHIRIASKKELDAIAKNLR